jgi:hypothetical protein
MRFLLISCLIIFSNLCLRAENNLLDDTNNVKKRTYLSKDNYPDELKASSIKIVEPSVYNNRNYGADQIFYENDSNPQFYYKYDGPFLCKINKSNRKVVDKLKIDYNGWCSGEVEPDGIFELDASGWKNVKLMLCVIKTVKCSDDANTFYIVVDANNKLKKIMDINNISINGGEMISSENLAIPDNSENSQVILGRNIKQYDENNKLIKEENATIIFKWDGLSLIEVND